MSFKRRHGAGNARPRCGGQALRHKFVGTRLFPGLAVIALGHYYYLRLGANLWGPRLFLRPTWDWLLNHLQECSDAKPAKACSGSQKVAQVETEPEPGCQMGVCLAAHTMAHSGQPLPPTDFSLQFKDDVCVSPMQSEVSE